MPIIISNHHHAKLFFIRVKTFRVILYTKQHPDPIIKIAHNTTPELASVADPDTCFGPPGSGLVSQRSGSGSGSYYYHSKIERKPFIPAVL
jgi:hypothetical protein